MRKLSALLVAQKKCCDAIATTACFEKATRGKLNNFSRGREDVVIAIDTGNCHYDTELGKQTRVVRTHLYCMNQGL